MSLSPVSQLLLTAMLVPRLHYIDGYRAKLKRKDKAQCEGNGWPFSSAVTPYLRFLTRCIYQYNVDGVLVSKFTHG